jgi:phosphotransferase system HPr (HPr) family protein
MINSISKVINDVGLHARPAAEFVKLASGFQASIKVRNLTSASAWVDAKSIISILMLGVSKDHEVELMADGLDEELAITTLRNLIESNFK